MTLAKTIAFLFILVVGILNTTVRPIQIHWEVFWMVILYISLSSPLEVDEPIGIPILTAGLVITAMMRFM